MRNKYGIIPIKVRAKDKSTIDFTDVSFDDIVIDGKISDAQGNKIIFLDFVLENNAGDFLYFLGLTTLSPDNNILVLGYNQNSSLPVQILLTDSEIAIS